MPTEHRRKRDAEDPDGIHAIRIGTPPEQLRRAGHRDPSAALGRLTPQHREALMIVGVQGLSYEEIAEICGVTIGTVKSRVDPARRHPAELLAEYGSFGLDGVTSAAHGAVATSC